MKLNSEVKHSDLSAFHHGLWDAHNMHAFIALSCMHYDYDYKIAEVVTEPPSSTLTFASTVGGSNEANFLGCGSSNDSLKIFNSF